MVRFLGLPAEISSLSLLLSSCSFLNSNPQMSPQSDDIQWNSWYQSSRKSKTSHSLHVSQRKFSRENCIFKLKLPCSTSANLYGKNLHTLRSEEKFFTSVLSLICQSLFFSSLFTFCPISVFFLFHLFKQEQCALCINFIKDVCIHALYTRLDQLVEKKYIKYSNSILQKQHQTTSVCQLLLFFVKL